MATIGVKYNDSGVGTDIAKILMKAVVGDPDTDMKMATLESNLMGAKIDRERTLALAQYEKEEAARKQGVYNYAESSIDPATELAMDSYNRNNPTAEAPVPVAPLDVELAGNAGGIRTDLAPPVVVEPTAVPAARVAAMPALTPAPASLPENDLTTVLPEGPVPIEADFAPVAADAMPDRLLKQAPGAIGSPADLTAPQPDFAGGAKNNGATITTPQGHTLSKAQVRSLVAVAAHSDDPYGSLRKLTGQLGLTYGDTPEELEKAMIMLGEDPGKLPAHLGGEAGSEVKQSDIKGMRDSVTKARERLTTVEPLYKSLETSLPRTDHVSDLDFIYGVATILDPDSVVRETDAVTIARSAGLSPELIGRINAVNGGQSLDRDTRLKLMALAKARIDGYRSVFDKTARDYVERAKRNKWNPLDVVSQEDFDRLANPPAPDIDTSTPPPGWTPQQWATRSEEQKQKILADIASRAGGGG